MEKEFKERTPRVRCYECGWSHIHALCHHCWRPGCSHHVHPTPRWIERLAGKEATGVGLETEQAYHCAECTHVPTGSTILAVGGGAATAFAGLILAWLNLILGLVLFLAGASLSITAGLVARRRASQARTAMPMPVRPKLDTLRLAESLHASIILREDGEYTTEPSPVEGELRTALVFSRPDRERLEHRLSKGSAAAARDVPFTAGRIVLLGPAGVKGQDFSGPIIALEGSTGAYPVFRAEDPHVSSRWNVALRYQLAAEPDLGQGLVWITPSIVPESGRHALELEIQWIELGPADAPLGLDVIDLLELRVPASWGNVEQVSLPATRRLLGTGEQVIAWRRLSPEGETGPGRLTLAVRFQSEIDNRADVIAGRLEATMKGALSGVEGVRLYGALGNWRSLPSVSITTQIKVDFKLSLASIRYQATCVFGDRTHSGGGSGHPTEFQVIPDDETVIALTNAMSEYGCYVKRVIENPPRSGGRANLVQRYWDVAGRLYEGVYPIDFQMDVTGEEVHRGDIRPEEGTTKVQITVKGAYTDSTDSIMYKRVRDAWQALCSVAAETLAGEEAEEAAARRPASAVPEPEFEAADAAEAAWAVDPESPTPPDVQLRQHLIKLDSALAEGRISPEQYTEMRERAEREFGGG